ncbi:hypothetical protein FLBR109950_02595 [Flavobacterium branchiophilum]|uniref:Uncharacterized protein n=1 Tax=Flavobacterium branchiophilum (strain FL-15) TaxID=1034807 RepID=G2Z378_FLABF|nr:hypothetical protein [Flavobacterium branchiophilum]CCB68191.1 Protein of unknown function [Flavobacterium branchiophilum FL-15]
MKKKLEADLMSIAHQILRLKGHAELPQLQAECLKLYEKISILMFVENHFHDVVPTIGSSTIFQKLEHIYSQNTDTKAEEVVVKTLESLILAETESIQTEKDHFIDAPQIKEFESTEIVMSPSKVPVEMVDETKNDSNPTTLKDLDANEKTPIQVDKILEQIDVEKNPIIDNPSSEKPTEVLNNSTEEPLNSQKEEENHQEEEKFEVEKTPTLATEAATNKTTIVELDYADPVFERIEKPTDHLFKNDFKTIENTSTPLARTSLATRFGLNDKIGFVQYLFDASFIAFNTFVAQIDQLPSFDEAKIFIDTEVKPKYDHWKDMESYETRLLDTIKQYFLYDV